MANVVFDQNWVKIERFSLTADKAFMRDLKNELLPLMRGVRNDMRANVSGSVLHRVSNRLFQSVRGAARIYSDNQRVWARAGTKYYIGRFWETGFTRYGRQYAPRKWATPAIARVQANLRSIGERAVNGTLRREGLK